MASEAVAIKQSRVGKRPIPIPKGVTVNVSATEVSVQGPKGKLSGPLPDRVQIKKEGETLVVTSSAGGDDAPRLQGLGRALVANMVKGVVTPFARELEIQGVGYRAEASGRKLTLLLGYSHPIEMTVPEGLSVSVDRNVIVRVEGIDRRRVGQFAANLRALRPPEPYKGKGIRYVNEHVRRKVGKAAAGAAG